MPPILDAVRAYRSIGEICGVLRAVFGEYTESVIGDTSRSGREGRSHCPLVLRQLKPTPASSR